MKERDDKGRKKEGRWTEGKKRKGAKKEEDFFTSTFLRVSSIKEKSV